MSLPSEIMEDRRERSRAWLVVVIFVLAGAFAAYLWMNRPGRVVGRREAIQYDDFAYEVVDVKTQRLAGRAYTVVTLTVHNRAQRVDYQFHRDIVVIEAADRRRFTVSAEGQRALDGTRGGTDPCVAALPAGASCTTTLAFDLPPDLPDPRLLIRHGAWFGAIVDDLLVGRKEIRLAPR